MDRKALKEARWFRWLKELGFVALIFTTTRLGRTNDSTVPEATCRIRSVMFPLCVSLAPVLMPSEMLGPGTEIEPTAPVARSAAVRRRSPHRRRPPLRRGPQVRSPAWETAGQGPFAPAGVGR